MILLEETLYLWQTGRSISAIARMVGMSRQTVRKYLDMGVKHGFVRDATDAQRKMICKSINVILHQHDKKKQPSMDLLEQHRDQIEAWLREPDMTVKQIMKLLKDQGQTISYTSLKRFVSKIHPTRPNVTVRMETQPGVQAQVDFGEVKVLLGSKKKNYGPSS